jgi:hypothetical protein
VESGGLRAELLGWARVGKELYFNEQFMNISAVWFGDQNNKVSTKFGDSFDEKNFVQQIDFWD